MTERTETAPAPAEDVPEYRLLSVRQLMWRKFLKNRLAVLSGWVLIVLYAMTIFAGFQAVLRTPNPDPDL